MGMREAIDSGKFIVTSELGPPKGVHIEHMLDEAELVKGRVDGYNVTDLQASCMRLGSNIVCHALYERGMSPILQMVCRDRNRLALQSDLLGAYVLGIRDVLCLTGDYVTLGDHPGAKPVFDLDSVQLLMAAKGLMEGHDLAGNELEGDPPRFTLGAVVNPGADPLEPQLLKLEKKVEAGAEFIQTQAVYDLDAFAKFMDKVRHLPVKILGGIVMLKSAGMAKYMNKNVAGVTVPDHLIQKMADAEDRVAASIEIAADLIKGMKDLCDGVHIMSLGWDRHVPALLDAAGLP